MIVKKILKISVIAITTMTCQLMSSEGMQINDIQTYKKLGNELFEKMDRVYESILATRMEIGFNTHNDILKNIVNNILDQTEYCRRFYYDVEPVIQFYNESINQLKDLLTTTLTVYEKNIVNATIDDCKKLIEINENLIKLKKSYNEE